MALLRGTLQRIVFQGRNHWSVAILRTNEGDNTIVGHLVAVKEGDSLELHGEWVIDRKYGRQFKLKSCAVSAKVDAEGTIAWLTGLPDVGRARAIQIVEKLVQYVSGRQPHLCGGKQYRKTKPREQYFYHFSPLNTYPERRKID